MITVDADEIDKNLLTAGYVTTARLDDICTQFSIPSACSQLCKNPPVSPKPFVELYDDFTFLFLATPAADGGDFDIAAVFIKKNFLLVVDVRDSDCSTRNGFFSALSKYPLANVSLEKLLAAFLNAVTADDFKSAEEKSFEISRLEEIVLSERAGQNFNSGLLKIKRELLLMQNYYEHLIDIGEALEENENEIFSKKELRCISGFTQRARRLREDADSLQSAVMHLQDSYQSSLDLKLNNTMNFFTVITAVFFPLTVIVGWYGMNFDSMPELRWRYGYAFVIALSVGVVSLLLYAVKRHRWL